MFTELIEGETPLAIDPEILTVAEKQTRESEIYGSTRGVAILNDAGRLYRVIASYDPHEASNVVDALCSQLGFIDRVGFDSNLLREVDTLTGKPLNTRWSAVLQLGKALHPIPAVPRIDGL